jgi:hypothetical protein
MKPLVPCTSRFLKKRYIQHVTRRYPSSRRKLTACHRFSIRYTQATTSYTSPNYQMTTHRKGKGTLPITPTHKEQASIPSPAAPTPKSTIPPSPHKCIKSLHPAPPSALHQLLMPTPHLALQPCCLVASLPCQYHHRHYSLHRYPASPKVLPFSTPSSTSSRLFILPCFASFPTLSTRKLYIMGLYYLVIHSYLHMYIKKPPTKKLSKLE